MRKALVVIAVTVMLSVMLIGAVQRWRGRWSPLSSLRPRRMRVLMPSQTREPSPSVQPLVDLPYSDESSRLSTGLVLSLDWSRQLRDDMCKCGDVQCVHAVDLHYRRMSVEFTPKDREATTRTLHESSVCAQRILDRRPSRG